MPVQLQPADESFFSSAPERYSRTFAIARPAHEVWAGLVSDRPLDWCRPLSAAWTSPRPFGVGTTRQAKVFGALKVQETFFVWEEGRRQAFYVTEATLPIFRRLAEDFVVEPDGADACRFTWSVGLEPTTLAKPGRPLNAVLFKSLFRDTARHFDAT